MQCSAKRSNGTTCTRHAINGGNVCYVHGGAAPQVKQSARERIAAMVDPALGVLYNAMKIKEKGKPMPLAVAAARDVLDRAGYKATDKLVITGSGPAGEVVYTTPAELLKAELDALHERIPPGTTGSLTSGDKS
jgi:hypothetical protein